MSERRLPVYVLADCSGSMSGPYIESVKSGIRALHSELMGDPNAVENAYLSIITFGSDAEQVIPLTEIGMFNPPDLTAGGTTAFGAALNLLMDCLDHEVRKTTPEQKGDWKPLVFIFTDGVPTDPWEHAADALKARKLGNIIAVACGKETELPKDLKRVTETVLVMREMSPDAFKAFFKWVTASIKQTSSKIGGADASLAAGINLPPPPAQITIHP